MLKYKGILTIKRLPSQNSCILLMENGELLENSSNRKELLKILM